MKKILRLVLVVLIVASSFITKAQSPCDFNGIHPFCTLDNPFGIQYRSGTSGTAANFLGGNAAGCCSTTPCAAWFYMKVMEPGNLLLYLQQNSQANMQGTGRDVDFACWGPFPTRDVPTFLDNLCNGTYTLYTGNGAGQPSGHPSSHRPSSGNHNNDNLGGWPYPSASDSWLSNPNHIPMVDCSYYADPTEWSFLPNTSYGEIYLILITNYSQQPGYISFSAESGSYLTASTACDILSPLTDNNPCEGQTLVVNNPNASASAPASTRYKWICPDGYTTTTTVPTLERQNALPSMSGIYKMVEIRGSQNGDTVYSPEIIVKANPVMHYSLVNGRAFCEGESVSLNISASNYDYAYFALNGSTNPQIDSVVEVGPFEIHNDTTIYVYVSDEGDYNSGCVKRDTFRIKCSRLSAGLIEEQICVGENYNAHGFTLPVQNAPKDTMLERHYTNAQGCDSVSQVLLHITANPKLEMVSTSPEHCGREDGQLIVSVTQGYLPYEYTWSPAVQALDTLRDVKGGDYTLTVVDSLGCRSTRTFNVVSLPNPVACFALIPEAKSYLVGENIMFNNCSQYQDYNHWDMGDNYTTEDFSVSYTYNEIGAYTITLEVSDTAGCSDVFEKIIEVHEKMRFYLPSSFTPNGDGNNDFFKPVQMEVAPDSYTLQIYDRWGSLVFMTHDLEEGWDGTSRGKLAERGSVFTYFATYSDYDGYPYEKKGSVTIVY